ncbi:MAG: hypothetical protein ACRD3W_08785, partial [Terriglobales bacterium]
YYRASRHSELAALPPPSALPTPPMPGAAGGAIYGDEGTAGSPMSFSFAKDAHLDSLISSGTGRKAVLASKAAGMLRNKEDIGTTSDSDNRIKSVEDKTFYLVDGFWTDSEFDAKKNDKPEVVEFGSKQYFDLIAADPELLKYFAAGSQVIVNYKGHCYKVVQPSTATG